MSEFNSHYNNNFNTKIKTIQTAHTPKTGATMKNKGFPLYVSLVMFISLFSAVGFHAFAEDAQKIENFIYSIHAFDGYSYKKTFCIEESEVIYLLENVTNILSARKSFIYYWPLLGRYRLDTASLNQPIDGKLEVKGNSIKPMLLEPVLYTYTNIPEDRSDTQSAVARSGRESSEQYMDNIRVLQGDDAINVVAYYEKLMDEFEIEEERWEKKYEEYVIWKDDMVEKIRKARAEGKEVGGLVEEIQSNQLYWWQGPNRPNYLIMPLSEAFIINLPKGEYRIRLIDKNGSVVEGSEKKIIVFSRIRTEGILYEFATTDTITKPKESKLPSSILYFDGSSDLYLRPYLQDEFNELYHERLMVNEARANQYRTKWEKTKRLDNTWMDIKKGSKAKEIILEDVFYTNQNSQTGAGYEIVYWDNRPDQPHEFVNPSFRAFHIPLDKKTRKIDIKLTSFSGKKVTMSDRHIRIVHKSGLLIIVLILSFVPIGAMGYMIYTRQKLYKTREQE